jgi:hypothetical protein
MTSFQFINHEAKLIFIEPLCLPESSPILFPIYGWEKWQTTGNIPTKALGLWRRDYTVVGGMIQPEVRALLLEDQCPTQQAAAFGGEHNLFVDVLVDMARVGLWLPLFQSRWGDDILPEPRDWVIAKIAKAEDPLSDKQWDALKQDCPVDLDLFSILDDGGFAYCT